MKAALYIRVSTHYQVDKDSLPFQRKELINYAKYVLGIDDFEVFSDAGYSGKNMDRPAFQDMINRIRQSEFTHLIVWKIDRISRNLLDFTKMYEELKKNNVTFVSKNEQFDTSSAMGEAMLKIILIFAELERKLTGERVYSVMLSRAEKGLWNGATVPLGYKWSDEVKFPVIDENEAPTVKYIYNLYENNQSTPKTAYQLNLEEVKTKRGGNWTAKTVGDILRNPFYIGTYRYNVKTSPNRRWKDKKEWVVVENNHPGIISPEQFERVNKILTNNYRGDSQYQRSNINTHILSGIVYCGNCNTVCHAGLDSPRKDGYRPSRYTCSTRKFNEEQCSNFISDITLLPFIINYISNFIKLQNLITQKHSLKDIEKVLLKGKSFTDVAGIHKEGLEQTYSIFVYGFENQEYDKPEVTNESNTNLELENLKKEKQKYEKAMERLESLYLFSDEAMSEKDFLFKKRDIVQNIDIINSKINVVYEKNINSKVITDLSFLKKAGYFLINQELINKVHIDYRKLLDTVAIDLIKDFVQTVIKKVVVIDKKVISITFVNGIVHKFAYKEIAQQKIRTREKFLYLSFEPILLEYLKEHKSVTRKDVEKLTGMSRSGAYSILQEFMDRGIIERKGESISIKYVLKE